MVHQAQVSWEQNTMSSQAHHCIYVSLWNNQQQLGLKGTLYFSCSGQQDVLSGVILTIAYLKYLFEFEHPSEVVLVKCFLMVVGLSP